MTIDELEKLLDNDDEYLKFDRVTDKLSNRPDLHAFIMLDRLVPQSGNKDLISNATHDLFYLDIDVEKLSEVILDHQVIDLVRCGVMYDDEYDCLSMYT